MSEEFEGQTKPGAEKVPPGSGETGGEPRRALPATTGRSASRWLGDWVIRTLDVVDIMADATREAVLKKRF